MAPWNREKKTCHGPNIMISNHSFQDLANLSRILWFLTMGSHDTWPQRNLFRRNILHRWPYFIFYYIFSSLPCIVDYTPLWLNFFMGCTSMPNRFGLLRRTFPRETMYWLITFSWVSTDWEWAKQCIVFTGIDHCADLLFCTPLGCPTLFFWVRLTPSYIIIHNDR